MKQNNKSYPYPVLGVGDDILSKTNMVVEKVKSDSENYYITVHIEMHNSDIESLIADNYAEYGCEVECSRTFFLKWYGFKQKDFTITIPRNSVASKITFDCRVSVVKDITDYSNKEAHEDYSDIKFNLPVGSILAYFGSFNYNADIEYDRLQSAGSFLTIIEGPNLDTATYVLGHQKIEIKLPTPLFKEYLERYNRKSCKWGNIFHSSIAFNALVFALLNYDESIHEDLLWAKTIRYRIEIEPSLKQFQNALEDKDPYEILKLAQSLLSDPYKRMLKTIRNLDEAIESADSNYDNGMN